MVKLALADALWVPPARQKELRYLACYHATSQERAGYFQGCSFFLNSLSRERAITRPAIVAGSDGTLLCLFSETTVLPRLLGTAWFRKAQDQLPPALLSRTSKCDIQSLVSSYTTREVSKTRQVLYRDYYGQNHYRTEEYKVQEQVKTPAKQITSLAPIHGLPMVETAALATLLESRNPIVRADWWLAYASWSPAYYDLLGLDKTRKSFETLLYADPALAAKAAIPGQRSGYLLSVALHNRTLLRMPTFSGPLGGYFWESHDSDKSIDDQDYINVLLEEKFTATEIIGSLPNGLQAYFVADGKGNRLDVAAADVAQDHETPLQDHQVWVARNCVGCHAKGIRPIQDEVRALSRDQIALLVTDPKQARRIAALYFSTDLRQVVQHDQALFVAAVEACNDLTAEGNGVLFNRLVHRYLDVPLTPECVAAEVGCTPERLLKVLGSAVGIDHTLTGLLAKPPRPLRRDQFERRSVSST